MARLPLLVRIRFWVQRKLFLDRKIMSAVIIWCCIVWFFLGRNCMPGIMIVGVIVIQNEPRESWRTYERKSLPQYCICLLKQVWQNCRILELTHLHHLYRILTPTHVLFLICLYISSRALSKVFEHRNFVARYRRETNHICENFAPW